MLTKCGHCQPNAFRLLETRAIKLLMQIAGIGRIIFWSGGSLWIGRAFAPSEFHSHHAIQVSIGLSDRVQFRNSEATPWQFFDAVAIPPDLTHAFQAPGCLVVQLFCEPESALGRNLLSRFGSGRLQRIPSSDIASNVKGLRAAFEKGLGDEELEEIALETLYSLSGRAPTGLVDERILRAAAFIGARFSEPLTLGEVARHVGLSSGRFRHLFSEGTGISFRAYLLWTRLNRALELGFGGMSWTDAAHATNFADSAHLSRTMRRMFGIAPSSLRQDLPSRSMTA